MLSYTKLSLSFKIIWDPKAISEQETNYDKYCKVQASRGAHNHADSLSVLSVLDWLFYEKSGGSLSPLNYAIRGDI